MATRPSLHVAVQGTKNTAYNYNDNFDMMMDYIDDTLDECKDYVDDFMPSVTGQSGKFLTNDGTGASWAIAVSAGIVTYYGGSNAPSGWLVCDGSALSRTTYADLYSAIGTNFGEGDGSTTFNLPNLVGDHPFIEGSETVGTETDAGLPNITGEISTYKGNQSGVFWQKSTISKGWDSDGSRALTGFDASRSSSIYGGSTTVQPASVTLLPIIKY